MTPHRPPTRLEIDLAYLASAAEEVRLAFRDAIGKVIYPILDWLAARIDRRIPPTTQGLEEASPAPPGRTVDEGEGAGGSRGRAVIETKGSPVSPADPVAPTRASLPTKEDQ